MENTAEELREKKAGRSQNTKNGKNFRQKIMKQKDHQNSQSATVIENEPMTSLPETLRYVLSCKLVERNAEFGLS